ncbi:lipopolysaccharide biosynthesis protein [Imhoffiella purpurea]|uniref:Putative flippase n=1 Tax=Imhoffiella purpurea TaxID=1249627 RepID=W9V5M4_9GAMM|nr:MATE family efflux transporter [Imhoffiella purpurea]EXJ11402.1 putative flippase [Imhoffiella purpurea]
MLSEMGRRLRCGFGANVYGQGIVILIQLVGVPILLHAWGLKMYGEWLILSAIPVYLSMTDLGFSKSAGNDMAARGGRGDFAGMLCVFQSLAILVYSVAALGIILAAVLLTALPLHEWLDLSRLSASDVRWILWLLAAEVLVKLTDGVSHAGYRANGDYAFHTSVYYTTSFVQQSSIWLLASLGYTPVVAALSSLLVRCIVTPSVARILVVRHPHLRFGVTHASMSVIKALVRPALANLAIPLAQATNTQGFVLVIGALLGPTAVVIFSTQRTLTRLTLQMVISVCQALEPELARAWGAGNQDLLRRLYVRGFALAFWLGFASMIALYAIGPWILEFWTGGHVHMDHILFKWLLLSAFVSVLWYSGLNLLRAVNRHLRAAVWYVGGALVSILLAALLLQVSGRLANAGLASLFMDGLMAIYLIGVTTRFIQISPSRLLLTVLDLPNLVNVFFGRAFHGN